MPIKGSEPVDLRGNKIYAIPGLGTDRRIFSRLELPNLSPLEWLTPDPQETLVNYSYRMSQQITQPYPILLGVSFGGIVAQEIAARMDISRLILISTIVEPNERSWQLEFMRHIPLYKLTKGDWRIRTLPYWAKWYGITDHSEIELLQRMFSRFSDTYRMWAIEQVISWKGLSSPLPIPTLRLHGSKDPLFPCQKIKSDEVIFIQGGDHFMIYRKPLHVTQHIQRWLTKPL